MFAEGPFNVNLGPLSVAMVPVGGFMYIGDISAVAGQTVELTIINTSWSYQDPLTIDGIAFLPIPEPSTVASMLVGLAALATAVRRRQARSGLARPRS